MMVYLRCEAQAYKPALINRALCKTHAYNRALVVNVLNNEHTYNRALIHLELLYKAHAYKPALTVKLQCLGANSKHVLLEAYACNSGGACM